MINIEIKKVASANEIVDYINRLNYLDATFDYKISTFSNNRQIEYRHFYARSRNFQPVSFALIEIVADGTLQAVRFFNIYRDIIVEFKLTDIELDYCGADNLIIVE